MMFQWMKLRSCIDRGGMIRLEGVRGDTTCLLIWGSSPLVELHGISLSFVGLYGI
jgi:hypothetical protein